ncbi:MAG: LEPR-XLL domain-containing protein [Planctomycetes bacterium]|nr:LEPR-XLL domain-containing protein [Planctomycetota bacterium]
MGIWNWLRQALQRDSCGAGGTGRTHLEPLEPRVLLNADLGTAVRTLQAGDPSEPALLVNVPRAPALPGLELVDTDLEHLRGQIIYLDADGARDITYHGPATIGPFDVPAFQTPGRFAGAEPVILAQVRDSLRQIFAEAGVIFTLQRPAGGQPCSMVYLGGDDLVFAAYGSFEGLAEAVDVGNRNAGDEALVFSQELGAGSPDLTAYVSRLVNVIAHEVGHLLGYAHPEQAGGRNRAGLLDAVAHATGPDDDQTAVGNGPVHQWLTYNAFLLYNSQFSGSELAQFIGDWQDYGRQHHRTNGDNNDVIEGAFDDDVSAPIVYPFDNGFHWDIVPQNPLGQSIPYEQHFVAGGDGNEIYDGWSTFASAVTQALSYWQPYVLATYPANAALAYYYLGHVAHLLEDMTVPAHVHNDAHPIRDAYEYTMGEYDNYLLWGYGAGARVMPVNPITIPSDLVSLFRETINYTEEYPSNGQDGEDGPEIPDAFGHRPDLVARTGGFTGDGAVLNAASSNEITILADDLMPWAMEKVAELFRLFYSLVDTMAPVVSLATSFGADEASAVLKPGRFHIVASAQDDRSGYDTDGFLFRIERQNGGVWEQVPISPGAGRFEFIAPGDGLYRISVEVSDAARNTGRSNTGYFRVDQASGLTPVYRFWSSPLSRHFYTIREAEWDKLINNYASVWAFEGIAYYVFADDAQPGVVPVYRFWSATAGAHFYTSGEAEKTKLIDLYSTTWTFEEVAFYAYPGGSEPAGTSAVFRFWSDTLAGHFFTISQPERDKLIRFYSLIWTYELAAWYAYEA